MLGAARTWLGPFTRALAAPFVWLRLPPTLLTLSALPVAVAAAWFLAEREWYLALVLGLVAGLLDVADGAVARARGRVTSFGGYLDSVLDRVVDLAFLFGAGFALSTDRGWLLVGIFAIGSYGTSYARARFYEERTAAAPAWHQFFERGERLILLGLGALGQGVAEQYRSTWPVFEAAVALGAAASLLTLLQRVLVARRYLRPAA